MLRKFAENINMLAFFLICSFMLVIMGFLSITSFFFTSDMNMANAVFEKVDFIKDNILLSLFILLAFVAVTFCLYRLSLKINMRILRLSTLFLVTIAAVVWSISSANGPINDSHIVLSASHEFSQGNYSALTAWYFTAYPFQLGYVFLNEIIFRIFGVAYSDGVYIFQAMNTVFLVAAYYALLRLSGEIFENEKTQRITALLLIITPQPILFSIFLYGNIPGLCFALYALLFMVYYLKRNKFFYAVISAFFIALAILVKMNYAIFLVAICIVVGVNFLKRLKNPLDLLYILLALALTIGMKQAIILNYELRANVEIGDGIPMTAWMLMGVNESEIADGWYNYKHTLGVFGSVGKDSDEAAKEVKNRLRDRFDYMLDNKEYTIKFFYRKTISQWNEPTYQSIWLNQRSNSLSEQRGVAKYFCNEGEGKLKLYMDFVQQLIYFTAFIGIISMLKLKNKRIYQTIILIIIFGGFTYHMFFEAKSQYIITYFILMLPISAQGLTALFNFGEDNLKKFRRGRSE